MNIPSRIRIKKKIWYEIVYADVVKNDPECDGYCDGNSRQIILKIDQDNENMIKTLIHEIFHAIQFEYRIPIPHSLISKLENAVYSFLTLNGWI